jgi:hypothetical protein
VTKRSREDVSRKRDLICTQKVSRSASKPLGCPGAEIDRFVSVYQRWVDERPFGQRRAAKKSEKMIFGLNVT